MVEFSYGFDVLDGEPNEHGGKNLRRVKVHEVSPVLLGAGIGTRTLAMKTAAAGTRSLPLASHAEEVLAELDAALTAARAFKERVTRLGELREADGRKLSEVNRARLAISGDALRDLAREALDMLGRQDPAYAELETDFRQAQLALEQSLTPAPLPPEGPSADLYDRWTRDDPLPTSSALDGLLDALPRSEFPSTELWRTNPVARARENARRAEQGLPPLPR